MSDGVQGVYMVIDELLKKDLHAFNADAGTCMSQSKGAHGCFVSRHQFSR